MISIDPLTRVAFRNISSSFTLHTGPTELCLQTMIHLRDAWMGGIFGSVSFIKNLLTQLMVLWNHQMMLEPEGAFLIHMETVDLRVTFGEPPFNVCDSLIAALSCNDFPSQHRGEGHIVQSLARRNANARLFPKDADSKQVVVVSFAAQGIRNHIHLTGMIVDFHIIVLD
jgi:hypothetical protein